MLVFFLCGLSFPAFLPAFGITPRHITSTGQDTTTSLENTARQETADGKLPFLYRLQIHHNQDGAGTQWIGSERTIMPGPVQPEGREMDCRERGKPARMPAE